MPQMAHNRFLSDDLNFTSSARFRQRFKDPFYVKSHLFFIDIEMIGKRPKRYKNIHTKLKFDTKYARGFKTFVMTTCVNLNII